MEKCFKKTVIVDNFLDNPDEVRNFALSLDYEKRNSDEYYEGIRSKMIRYIDYEFYSKVCSDILYEYFNTRNKIYEAELFFHQTTTEDKKDTQWLHDRVHTDPQAVLAGVGFLTPSAPIQGGTQTYLKLEDKFYPDIIMGNVYNRLILFPSDYFHSAIDLFGNIKDNRLTMLFFLNNINMEDEL